MSSKHLLAPLVFAALAAGCASVASRPALECEAPDDALRRWVASALPLAAEPLGSPVITSRQIAEIEKLALICPEHDDIALVQAIALVEAGERQRASAILDGLLARQPVHPEAAALRARLALQSGNPGFARALIDRQQRLAPDSAILQEARASIHFVAGDHDAALRALSDAEVLGASSARVAFNRGLVFEAQRDIDAARAAYERALSIDPAHEPARRRLRGLDVAGHSVAR